MTKSKSKTKYIVIPLLVLSLVGGAFTAAMQNSDTPSDTVNVAAVSDLDYSWLMGDYTLETNSFLGKLQKGSIQNVKYNQDLKIEDVLLPAVLFSFWSS